MSSPFISVIIVSWNALHYLKEFLPSICASSYKNVEIILADNASTDESASYVKKHFPSVSVFTMEHNFGYCGGNNRAAEIAKGDILLFLNNDVRVKSDWLEPIASAFSNPNIAVVQPKLLSLNQPEFYEYAGAAGGLMDKYGYPFCRGRIFDTLEKDLSQYKTTNDLFWASGAAIAIRRDLFHQLGGFDESFEFHMEEIDLCWRVKRIGFEIAYVPDSVVYHLGGGSLNSLSPRKTYYNFRNNWWMLQKNLNFSEFASILFPRLILDTIAFVKEIVTGRLGHAMALFAGIKDAFSQPKDFQRLTRNNNAEFLFSKSIVVEYFVKGNRVFSRLKAEIKK